MTLLGDDEPLSAGRRHEAKCEVAVVIVMVIMFVVMVMWCGDGDGDGDHDSRGLYKSFLKYINTTKKQII